MFFVLKFELILIIGSKNVLMEGARKVYRGQGWFTVLTALNEKLIVSTRCNVSIPGAGGDLVPTWRKYDYMDEIRLSSLPNSPCSSFFRTSWLFARAFLVAGRNTVDGGRRWTHGGQSSPGEARRHDATPHKSEILVTYILETFYAMSSTLPDLSVSVRTSVK
jgi:hypothetical protein